MFGQLRYSKHLQIHLFGHFLCISHVIALIEKCKTLPMAMLHIFLFFSLFWKCAHKLIHTLANCLKAITIIACVNFELIGLRNRFNNINETKTKRIAQNHITVYINNKLIWFIMQTIFRHNEKLFFVCFL